MPMRTWRAALAVALLTWPAAHAAVTPNPLFTDHLVLQREQPIPVWGQAAAGETVTVTLGDQTSSTSAGSDGRWLVRLAPRPAGGPYDLVIAGANTVTFHDILLGEVWVCSGQSNMGFTLDRAIGAEQAIAGSADSRLRLFTVFPKGSADLRREVEGSGWQVASPTTTPKFSAVGYFFGRRLRQELSVPVGLINASFGGKPAEAFTSFGALGAEPSLQPMLTAFQKQMADWPRQMAVYREKTLPAWQVEADAAKKAGKPAPRKPNEPAGPGAPHLPGQLFNSMISPLMPYGIRGAIWYQGEANAGRAKEYQTLFPTMIRDWRTRWGEGDFPFLFVQLAPYMKIQPKPADSRWAELREAQLLTTRTVPNTAMAVITDVGEEDDIHPRHKLEVGDRLALGALALAYGRKLEYSGPVFREAEFTGGVVRVSFDHVDGGLVARDAALVGFTLAGADRVFHPAQAVIRDNRVIVSCPEVPQPVAVRYGWADFPVVNLWNRAGLPASPFRSDDWARR